MIQEERERGVLLGHAACPLHGGSDSLALYEKEECIDGFCYAGCGYVSPSKLRREGVTDGKSELLVDLVKEANGGYVPDEATLARVEKIKELPCSGGLSDVFPRSSANTTEYAHERTMTMK